MMSLLKPPPFALGAHPAAAAGNRESASAQQTREAPPGKGAQGQAFSALLASGDGERKSMPPGKPAVAGYFTPVLRAGAGPVADAPEAEDGGVSREEGNPDGDAAGMQGAMPDLPVLPAFAVMTAAVTAGPPASTGTSRQGREPAAFAGAAFTTPAASEIMAGAAARAATEPVLPPASKPGEGSNGLLRAATTAMPGPDAGGRQVLLAPVPDRPSPAPMQEPAQRAASRDGAASRVDEPVPGNAKQAPAPAAQVSPAGLMTSSMPAVDTRSLATSIGDLASSLGRPDAAGQDRLPDGSVLAHASQKTMRIQLKPEHLGHVAVTLRQGSEGLVVEIRAETQEGRRLLELDADGVADWLRHQGCTVAELRVTGAHQSQPAPGALQGGGQERALAQDFAAGGQAEAREGRGGATAYPDGRGSGRQQGEDRAPDRQDQTGRRASGVIYV
ncbi:flagellar hook-length control protein FliK [Zhengella sp. ZM62]|uniref:flagellar hook-length control protein FliK n=1 Tax=Zhengella sedimenti TaxID=3390035 RepID=UPI0039770880